MNSFRTPISPQKILCLMAMPIESQDLIEPWLRKQQIRIEYTGVGSLKAAARTSELIATYQPQLIINVGTAGSRRFKSLEVVECTEFYRRDNSLAFLAPKIVVSPLTKLSQTSCGSADFVDFSPEITKFGVVDMEAYAIASVCKSYQTDFLCIKAISDSSGAESKTMSELQKEWELNLKPCAKVLRDALEKVLHSCNSR